MGVSAPDLALIKVPGRNGRKTKRAFSFRDGSRGTNSWVFSAWTSWTMLDHGLQDVMFKSLADLARGFGISPVLNRSPNLRKYPQLSSSNGVLRALLPLQIHG